MRCRYKYCNWLNDVIYLAYKQCVNKVRVGDLCTHTDTPEYIDNMLDDVFTEFGGKYRYVMNQHYPELLRNIDYFYDF